MRMFTDKFRPHLAHGNVGIKVFLAPTSCPPIVWFCSLVRKYEVYDSIFCFGEKFARSLLPPSFRNAVLQTFPSDGTWYEIFRTPLYVSSTSMSFDKSWFCSLYGFWYSKFLCCLAIPLILYRPSFKRQPLSQHVNANWYKSLKAPFLRLVHVFFSFGR